mmetsp:Transcript_16220/g.21222  ORF Transcript_16220/g.21222 Transcript_16220/m.21222 type:complete len:103 (-) Transcript_16220:572-880(-)
MCSASIACVKTEWLTMTMTLTQHPLHVHDNNKLDNDRNRPLVDQSQDAVPICFHLGGLFLNGAVLYIHLLSPIAAIPLRVGKDKIDDDDEMLTNFLGFDDRR